MKKMRIILLSALFGMYIIGVAAGSIRQVRAENQAEMYSYLEGAVSEYEADTAEGIRAVARDNAIMLLFAAPSVFFKLGLPGLAAVMLVKGYTAGFAATAALRFYGVGGLMICGANFISLALLIPALACCGAAAVGNLIYGGDDRKAFLKRAVLLLILLTLIFAADSVLRGIFSTIFTRSAVRIMTGF